MDNDIKYEEGGKYKLNAIVLFITFFLINLFFIRRSKMYIGLILLLSVPYIFKKILKVKARKTSALFLLFWAYYALETFMYMVLKIDFYTDRGVFDFIFRLFLIMLVFFLFSANTEKVNDYFFILIRKLGFFVCILGWIEYIKKKSLLYGITTVAAKDWQASMFGTSRFRIYTMFLHPIAYGLFLVILFWIVVNYKYKNYFFNAVYIFLIISNLYFTGSRSSWITLIITLIVNYFTKMKSHTVKKKRTRGYYLRMYFGIVIFIVLCCIFRKQLIDAIQSIILRFDLVINKDYMDGSRTQRLGAFTNIMEFIKTDLLGVIAGKGVGYSALFTQLHPINDGFNIVDNQYISIIYDSGIIGLGIFLSIFISTLRNASKYSLYKSKKVCFIGIIAVFINIFFYEGLTFYGILVLLSIFIFMINSDYSGGISE